MILDRDNGLSELITDVKFVSIKQKYYHVSSLSKPLQHTSEVIASGFLLLTSQNA